MNNKNENLTREVVGLLTKNASRWDLTEIEPSTEGSVIADAHWDSDADLPANPRLVVNKYNDRMSVEVRELAYLGRPGSVSNATAALFLARLFIPQEDEKDKGLVNTLLRLSAQNYLASAKTCDDLLADVIQGSNDALPRSRAVIDRRDGEVFCSLVIDCLGDDMPAAFDSAVDAVLTHAQLIVRFVQIARKRILPDPAPAAMEMLTKMLRRKDKDDNDTEQPSQPANSTAEPPMTL